MKCHQKWYFLKTHLQQILNLWNCEIQIGGSPVKIVRMKKCEWTFEKVTRVSEEEKLSVVSQFLQILSGSQAHKQVRFFTLGFSLKPCHQLSAFAQPPSSSCICWIVDRKDWDLVSIRVYLVSICPTTCPIYNLPLNPPSLPFNTSNQSIVIITVNLNLVAIVIIVLFVIRQHWLV